MYIGLHVKCPLFLSDLNETRIFLRNIQNIKFHESLSSVEANLFHANGHAYMMKLTVAFRNFANAPKNATELNEPCM